MMSLIKQRLRLYVKTNLHVSLAVISLVLLTFIYSGVSVDWSYVTFAGLGTIVAYTYIKNVPPQVTFTESLSHVVMRSPYWIHATALVCLGLILWLTGPQRLVLMAVLGLCVGYILPWPVFNRPNNLPRNAKLLSAPLRDFGPIKTIIVALVWSAVSVLLPLLTAGELSPEICLLFIAQTLWVVVLTIPFEIRDSCKDQLRHPTWPQKMGLLPVKILGSALLMASFSIHIWLFYGDENPAKYSFLDGPYVMAMMLTVIGLLWAKPKQSFWYSAFWIEAIPIVWLMLSVLFNL